MVEWITDAVKCAAALGGGGFFGWLFTRSKYKAEVDGAKIDNFNKSIEAYKNMYDNMVDELEEKNASLREENASLRKEIEDLRKEIEQTRQQLITVTSYILSIKAGANNTDVSHLEDIVKGGTAKNG